MTKKKNKKRSKTTMKRRGALTRRGALSKRGSLTRRGALKTRRKLSRNISKNQVGGTNLSLARTEARESQNKLEALELKKQKQEIQNYITEVKTQYKNITTLESNKEKIVKQLITDIKNIDEARMQLFDFEKIKAKSTARLSLLNNLYKVLFQKGKMEQEFFKKELSIDDLYRHVPFNEKFKTEYEKQSPTLFNLANSNANARSRVYNELSKKIITLIDKIWKFMKMSTESLQDLRRGKSLQNMSRLKKFRRKKIDTECPDGSLFFTVENLPAGMMKTKKHKYCCSYVFYKDKDAGLTMKLFLKKYEISKDKRSIGSDIISDNEFSFDINKNTELEVNDTSITITTQNFFKESDRLPGVVKKKKLDDRTLTIIPTLTEDTNVNTQEDTAVNTQEDTTVNTQEDTTVNTQRKENFKIFYELISALKEFKESQSDKEWNINRLFKNLTIMPSTEKLLREYVLQEFKKEMEVSEVDSEDLLETVFKTKFINLDSEDPFADSRKYVDVKSKEKDLAKKEMWKKFIGTIEKVNDGFKEFYEDVDPKITAAYCMQSNLEEMLKTCGIGNLESATTDIKHIENFPYFFIAEKFFRFILDYISIHDLTEEVPYSQSNGMYNTPEGFEGTGSQTHVGLPYNIPEGKGNNKPGGPVYQVPGEHEGPVYQVPGVPGPQNIYAAPQSQLGAVSHFSLPPDQGPSVTMGGQVVEEEDV